MTQESDHHNHSTLSSLHPQSLFQYALKILSTDSIPEKHALTLDAYKSFFNDDLEVYVPESDDVLEVPLYPARPSNLTVLAPGQMHRSRGPNSLRGRQEFIHGLCHMEAYAIDISWDIIARYVMWWRDEVAEKQCRSEQDSLNEHGERQQKTTLDTSEFTTAKSLLPRSFFADWLIVAEDEAKHFGWLSARLRELGTEYGAIPVHDGLWESCVTTKDSLLARLCILHCVHEARGLDIMPQRIEKMEKAQDEESAELLRKIMVDETDHVKKGVKWFRYLCEDVYKLDTTETFGTIVQDYFRGKLKPPFNEEARRVAEMPEEWYKEKESEKEEQNEVQQ